MPTQLALHFWPSWAHVFGIRVDYLAPTLYLTDLLLIVLIITWINPLIRNLYALRLKPYAIILGFSILVAEGGGVRFFCLLCQKFQKIRDQ